MDGPKLDVVLHNAGTVVLCDHQATLLHTLQVPDMLDFVTTDTSVIVIAAKHIHCFDRDSGKLTNVVAIEHLNSAGYASQSSTYPNMVVWQAAVPRVIKWNADGSAINIEPPPVTASWQLPLSESRWVAWQGGQLRLWRSMGDLWRTRIAEPNLPIIAGQLLLMGRMLVLVQKSGTEVRLIVVAMNDGSLHTTIRLEQASDVQFAPGRGYAIARIADKLVVIDVRFGRVIQELSLPKGTSDVGIDPSMHRVAVFDGDQVAIVAADSLTAEATRQQDKLHASHAAAGQDHSTEEASALDQREEEAFRIPWSAPSELIDVIAQSPGQQRLQARTIIGTDTVGSVALTDLTTFTLHRLHPRTPAHFADPVDIQADLDAALDVVKGMLMSAFATAWDNGRLSRQTDDTLMNEYEVDGLMKRRDGMAVEHINIANNYFKEALIARVASHQALGGRNTPLQQLQRDFGLSNTAVDLVVIIASPNIRSGYPRLFGYLSNDPARPLIDEESLMQLFGKEDFTNKVIRELDPDMPLRKYGIVHMVAQDRPFAGLTVDEMIVRYIRAMGMGDAAASHVTIRTSDRSITELQMPPEILHRAFTELSQQSNEEVRIAVRGRVGSGRHTLLATLAGSAGRDVGIIDVAQMPRGPGIAILLQSALRRCQLRGAVPCIDGLQSTISDEDPDTKLAVLRIIRAHPGPLAIHLLPEAQIPLDPGYLLYDIRSRTEVERGESWRASVDRHAIDMNDASDLAARYRVGPGVVERVVSEAARRSDVPSTPAGWSDVFNSSVRQYLENKLGQNANRVTRLASWADIVLPDDIIVSLRELTSRVRHRKAVYETWGFDKSITSARGITALFSGTPGTGKTMVAGVIARDLGLEVYRVDVSRITSKWIGETEKNLGSLFDAAEDGQVMLLFDEADSLFGKRTEVKSSVDRYANMETNYLLQRLDTFEGIAILTTNFGTAIDPAFKRRLTYRMTFPFPDEEMREKLWAALIPATAPVHGKLDFKSLAQRFKLSGGYIRNAVLRAAFIAVDDGGAITQQHLEDAIRLEFREIGKLTDSGTLE